MFFMERRDFIKSVGALGSGGLLDSDISIDRLSDLSSQARQAMSICEGQIAEDYVLCRPSNGADYRIAETSNTDLTPENSFFDGRAGYTLLKETEHGYPENFDTDGLSLPETGSMNIYLADPAFLGIETGWEENMDETVSDLRDVREDLQRSIQNSSDSGLQISDIYASGALEALSMTYQLEKGLENIREEAYESVTRAVVDETPMIVNGNLHDFNSDGELTEADVFRASYLSSTPFFQDFVPHVLDYNRDGEVNAGDLEILYSQLAEENPEQAVNSLEERASQPEQLSQLAEALGQEPEKRKSQEPIEIELYGTEKTAVFLEPAKDVVEAVLGSFYHESMYDVSIDYTEIELEAEKSRERLAEFQEIAGEGERDYQLLLDVDPIGEKRSIAGVSEFDQLFEEDKTSTGIALLNSEDRAEMVMESDRFPFIVDELDSRGIIAHELFHGLGVGHQKSEVFTDTAGDQDIAVTTPVGLGYISYMRYNPDKAEEALGEELFNHYSSQMEDIDDITEAEIRTVMTPSSEAVETMLEKNRESQPE